MSRDASCCNEGCTPCHSHFRLVEVKSDLRRSPHPRCRSAPRIASCCGQPPRPPWACWPPATPAHKRFIMPVHAFCYRDAKLAALVQCSFYSQGRGAVGHEMASSSAQASLTMGHECSQPRAGYKLWVRAQHLGALARDFARRRGWLALGAGCGGRAISRLALLLSRRLASSAFGSALLACGHAMRSVENAKHVWFAELQDAFLPIAYVRLSQPAL